MTSAEANAVRWSLLAVATLAFAADDVARGRQDNGRYLERIRARYPRLHALIEEAADTVAGGAG